MRIIERLKLFFKPKEEEAEAEKRELREDESLQKPIERADDLERQIAELRRKEQSSLMRDMERKRWQLRRRLRGTPVRSRQPASKSYTQKKVRGLPPRSAFSKRMWRTQVSKEELDEL